MLVGAIFSADPRARVPISMVVHTLLLSLIAHVGAANEIAPEPAINDAGVLHFAPDRDDCRNMPIVDVSRTWPPDVLRLHRAKGDGAIAARWRTQFDALVRHVPVPTLLVNVPSGRATITTLRRSRRAHQSKTAFGELTYAACMRTRHAWMRCCLTI